MAKVYVKTITERRYIASVDSSAFLSDVSSWIEIDEGSGDRYTHAQGNYFDKPIITEDGAHQYVYLGDRMWRECTEEEMAAEIQHTEPPAPTTEERIVELEQAIELLLSGVTE